MPPIDELVKGDVVLLVTEHAHKQLIELRDEEPEGSALGLRVEINGQQGTDFVYDLSFAELAKAGLTDVINNQNGLRVIIPAKDVESLRGAILDYETDGLVMRNPNRPRPPAAIENLDTTSDLAEQVRGVLDNDINPALAAHGGYVTLFGLEASDEGTVAYLNMGGGCQGCSMSRMTMMSGVQS